MSFHVEMTDPELNVKLVVELSLASNHKIQVPAVTEGTEEVVVVVLVPVVPLISNKGVKLEAWAPLGLNHPVTENPVPFPTLGVVNAFGLDR